ncbi:hypothetical protein PSE_3796 [Pseudovibrio sp. FO-BEG1]|nr:hypothetical protein PSE_3796 [Pseudovibrio sp. FO-BEG1]
MLFPQLLGLLSPSASFLLPPLAMLLTSSLTAPFMI